MSDKKISKFELDQQKESKKLSSSQEKIKDSLDKSGDILAKNEEKSSAILKASEANVKIQELRAAGDNARANILQSKLDTVQNLLEKDNMTSEQVAEAVKISQSLLDQSDNALKKNSNLLESMANNNETLTGLKLLNDELKEQKEIQKANADLFDIEKSLNKLEGFMDRNADETTLQLRSGYEEASMNLKDAIERGDDQAADIARRQIETIKEAAQTEEERREAAKAAELQSTALFSMGDKLEGLGEKMDSMGLAAKGGFLAGIAGLFLMFTDPEKFREIIVKVMDTVTSTFQAITQVLQGDLSGALETMDGKFGALGALVGVIALFFLPKIISTIGGVFKTLNTLVRAAKVFRLFMMGTFVPSMVAGLTSIGTAMGFAVGSLGVVLAPALLIVALIGGLYLGFKKLQDSLGPGASIMDTLKVAALYLVDFLSMLVNAITFIPRKIIGFLGKKAAKWLFGDDVDISMFDSISEGLDTNRGARAAEEIRLKNEEQAKLDAAEKEKETLEKTVQVIPPTTADNIENLESQKMELELDSKRDKPVPSQVNAVSTKSDNRSSVSTVINYPVMSPAAYALGDLGGR